MDNYNLVLEAQAKETDAAGLAQQRFGIYLEGVEAAQNRVTAATQHLWQDAISSGLIVSILNAVEKLLIFVDTLGGLKSVLISVLAIFAMYRTSAFITFIMSSTGGLKTLIPLLWKSAAAMLGLGAAATTATTMATAGLNLILLAIASLWIGLSANKHALQDNVYAIDSLSEKSDSARASLEQLNAEISNTAKSIAQAQPLVDEYNQLLLVAEKSTAEQERFTELQNELLFLLPGINGYFGEQGNFIISNTENLQIYVDLKKEELELLKEQRVLELTSAVIPNAEMELSRAQEYLVQLKSLQDYFLEQKRLAEAAAQAGNQEFSVLNWETGETDALSTAEAIDYFASKLEELPSRIETARLQTELLANGLSQLRLELLGLESPPEPTGENLFLQGFLTADEIADLIAEYNDLSAAMNVVTSAQKEQSDAGYVSAETAVNLIAAHEVLYEYLAKTADGFILNAEGARLALFQEMQLLFTNQGLGQAAIEAANGNYTLAASMIWLKGLTPELTKELLDLLAVYAAMGAKISVPGAGSSGGSGIDPAKKALDDMIDKIKEEKNAEKDALKEQLANYKRIIDARKALLKSLKEEADYKDEIAEKEKSLSRIQNELTELSLDNSEEANASRLKLQEDFDAQSLDLAKAQRDRQYELEMEMLDKELDAFESAIDRLIAVIDAYLKNTDLIKSDAANRLGASGGSGTSGNKRFAPTYTRNAQGAWDVAKPEDRGYVLLSDGTKQYYEEHHSGADSNFVGGLKSNEAFARLMKGELVINPRQMTNFMAKTLPAITSNVGGNIQIDMPINVAGNLDRSVVPDLEKITSGVVEELNKIMYRRGYSRTANQAV